MIGSRLLGPYQLILAKQNEINAQSEYVESLKDYWISHADLQRALGGDLRPAGKEEMSSPLVSPPNGDHGETP